MPVSDALNFMQGERHAVYGRLFGLLNHGFRIIFFGLLDVLRVEFKS